MATDLGKVGMVMKGDWSSSATYETLDVVSYSGSLYVAKQNVPANTLPTNTTYWQAAVSVSALMDGMTLNYSTNTTKYGNILIRAIGNRSSFKITLASSGVNNILIYIGYHAANSANENKRGLYVIDINGNIIDLSGLGGAVPTLSYDSTTLTYTITLGYNYAYIIALSTTPIAYTPN